MRAIGFDEPGGPEVLHVVNLAKPHAGPGQVRIRVKAATVNPSDLVTRSGIAHDRYRGVTPPYIPGWEAAGIIDEADPATGWRAGDEVIAITKPIFDGGGAYAEWMVVPAESVTRMPAGTNFIDAATLPMSGLTAYFALAATTLTSGQTLAVTGSAGAVGGYVIQLAKEAGLCVIADASFKDQKMVTALGADFVVPRGDNVANYIRDHAPNGVDAIIDGALQGQLLFPAIRDNGRYIALRPAAMQGSIKTERGIVIEYVMVNDHIHEAKALDELRKLTEEGKITLRVAGTFPADQAAEAHRQLAEGGIRGRLVLEF